VYQFVHLPAGNEPLKELQLEHFNEDHQEELTGTARLVEAIPVTMYSLLKSEFHNNSIQLDNLVQVQGSKHMGKTGFVRYIGKTHLKEWADKEIIGIELSEAFSNSGDHNGIIDNRRYFKCADLGGILVESTLVELSKQKSNETEANVENNETNPNKTEENEKEKEKKKEENKSVMVNAGLLPILGTWRVVLTDGTKGTYSIMPDGNVQVTPPDLYGWHDQVTVEFSDEHGFFVITCSAMPEVFQVVRLLGENKAKVEHKVAGSKKLGAMVKITRDVVEDLKKKI